MGLLNEIRLLNQINLTVEFATLMNMLGMLNEIWWICWECWMRYEREVDNTTEFVHCWISGTVEGDENVKRDKTINFVALLNM